uniref:Uncharacterized protein n=1 Tax=Arundo donax TaxID=35708 RepID=A0A0A9EN02_ARUDO
MPPPNSSATAASFAPALPRSPGSTAPPPCSPVRRPFVPLRARPRRRPVLLPLKILQSERTLFVWEVSTNEFVAGLPKRVSKICSPAPNCVLRPRDPNRGPGLGVNRGSRTSASTAKPRWPRCLSPSVHPDPYAYFSSLLRHRT